MIILCCISLHLRRIHALALTTDLILVQKLRQKCDRLDIWHRVEDILHIYIVAALIDMDLMLP